MRGRARSQLRRRVQKKRIVRSDGWTRWHDRRMKGLHWRWLLEVMQRDWYLAGFAKTWIGPGTPPARRVA